MTETPPKMEWERPRENRWEFYVNDALVAMVKRHSDGEYFWEHWPWMGHWGHTPDFDEAKRRASAYWVKEETKPEPRQAPSPHDEIDNLRSQVKDLCETNQLLLERYQDLRKEYEEYTNASMLYNQRQYWMKRSLRAEDIVETLQTWLEVFPKDSIHERLQSLVVSIRKHIKRDNTPDFCGDLMTVPRSDTWIDLNERKPTLKTPIVEVLFSDGIIRQSRFWVGFFENDFRRFEVSDPDATITHWRPIQDQ